MLQNASHLTGELGEGEILFQTPFGYMFPELAKSSDCKLVKWPATQYALEALGSAMGMVTEAQDSDIPSVYTYLGQFIDHDITARTDRDGSLSTIGGGGNLRQEIHPADPMEVEAKLTNGRRPGFDLDSVYGDGPGLLDISATGQQARTRAAGLYNPSLELILQSIDGAAGAVDLSRNGRTANIADGRNDENLNISQLHAAFIALHNKILSNHGLNGAAGYSEARRLVRWCYQYIVLNDYLTRVCDANVVADILINGNRYYLPNRGPVYMPLEFSTAAFRFGHAMIRPSYHINSTQQCDLLSLLDFANPKRMMSPDKEDFIEDVDGGMHRLKAKFAVAWSNYVETGGGAPINLAQKINPHLSKGLDELPFDRGRLETVLGNLAQRNLMRGYQLSIPSGQAVAYAMGEEPIDMDAMQDAIDSLAARLPNSAVRKV